MTQLLNRPEYKFRRQGLRKNSPIPELLLWKKLRNRQLDGYKIRRQYSIGGFVVDFYCPSRKLVIEVDGDSHYRKEIKTYDLQRERAISSLGLRIVRFTNLEVSRNLEGVLEKISSCLKDNTSS